MSEKAKNLVVEQGGDQPPTPRHYTPLGVSRAARRLDVALAEMHLDVSGEMAMTAAELLAITHLGMDGELGPGELAQRLHLRTGAITALLDRLVERGYAERLAHPTDRRRLLVRLTDRGRKETMLHLDPMVAEVMALVERLPVDDRQTVGRFLDDLARVVRHREQVDPR